MVDPARTKRFLLLRGGDEDAPAAVFWILRFWVSVHDQLKVMAFEASTYQNPPLARSVSEAPANAANVATLTLALPVFSKPVAVMVCAFALFEMMTRIRPLSPPGCAPLVGAAKSHRVNTCGLDYDGA